MMSRGKNDDEQQGKDLISAKENAELGSSVARMVVHGEL